MDGWGEARPVESRQVCDFRVDRLLQNRQSEHDSIPYDLRIDVFIVMSIDVASTRDLFPCDGWVSLYQILRQAP